VSCYVTGHVSCLVFNFPPPDIYIIGPPFSSPPFSAHQIKLGMRLSVNRSH